MPLLSILTTAEPTTERRAQLLSGLSRLLAKELEKPESYVMVSFNRPTGDELRRRRRPPACYAELKNVGTLSPERCEQLSALLCRELAVGLDVARRPHLRRVHQRRRRAVGLERHHLRLSRCTMRPARA